MKNNVQIVEIVILRVLKLIRNKIPMYVVYYKGTVKIEILPYL